MFWVEYFCPKQGAFWNRRNTAMNNLREAIAECRVVKPPLGTSRVLDNFGQVVFQC